MWQQHAPLEIRAWPAKAILRLPARLRAPRLLLLQLWKTPLPQERLLGSAQVLTPDFPYTSQGNRTQGQAAATQLLLVPSHCYLSPGKCTCTLMGTCPERSLPTMNNACRDNQLCAQLEVRLMLSY